MSAEQRIRELATDLAAVRPIPRLRWVAAAALAVWLAATGAEWWLGGPAPRGDGAWSRFGFLGVLVALAAVAGGGTAAALGSSVPGRERAARLGWGAVGVGAAGLLGFGAVALLAPGSGAFELPWFCIGRAGWIGALPALALAAFAARAFAARAAATALAASLGAVALGALVVQLSCRADGALHVWVGHALGPALLAGLLAVPCAWWLRRRRPRIGTGS